MFQHIFRKLRPVFQSGFIAIDENESLSEPRFYMFDHAKYLQEEFPQIFSLLQQRPNEYKVAHRGSFLARELYRQLRRLGVQCQWKDNSCIATCGGVSFRIYSSNVGLNGKRAQEICKNKDETKRILSEKGFRVPQGRVYASTEMPAESDLPFSFPIVLKPVDGRQGIGVNTNITSYDDVRNYWQTVPEGKSVLMEEFIAGIDLRCTVVNGKLIAALSRINAHVFGDGVSTIAELIQKKDEIRAGNPDTKSLISVVDPPRDLNVVPRAGEMVILNPLMNMSSGGDSVNVTPFLSEEVKKTIEGAVTCIEGANVIGVDIIASSFTDASKLVFIELNTSGAFTMHQYPCYGEPIEVVEAVAAYMKHRLLTDPLPKKTIKEIMARNKENADVQKLAWEINRMRSLMHALKHEEIGSPAKTSDGPLTPESATPLLRQLRLPSRGHFSLSWLSCITCRVSNQYEARSSN